MSWRVRRFLKTVRAQHELEREQDESTNDANVNGNGNDNNKSNNSSATNALATTSAATTSTKRVTIKTTPEYANDLEQHSKQPLNRQVTTDATTATANSNSLNSPVVAAISVIASLGRTSPDSSSSTTTGRYTNWCSQHTELASQPWCCIGDLIAFCDKYEYKTLSLTDTRVHNTIVGEVTSLLSIGRAPFDMRKRFPGNIQNPENLWMCIGRCISVEYHLKKILSVFRKPLLQLSTEKQRVARQNFHLGVNELRLDISARITDVRLYDRAIFERDFRLRWQDASE